MWIAWFVGFYRRRTAGIEFSRPRGTKHRSEQRERWYHSSTGFIDTRPGETRLKPKYGGLLVESATYVLTRRLLAGRTVLSAAKSKEIKQPHPSTNEKEHREKCDWAYPEGIFNVGQ